MYVLNSMTKSVWILLFILVMLGFNILRSTLSIPVEVISVYKERLFF